MSSLAQLFFDDSSSDDDDDLEMVTALYADFVSSKRPKHGGSVPGHALVHRRKQAGHDRLMADYFVDEPIFGPATFRRRFRMSRDLFLRIANAVEAHCPYFVQRRNASGQLGHSALKKIAAAVRMLAYGCPADSLDVRLAYGCSRLFVDRPDSGTKRLVAHNDCMCDHAQHDN
jgi:hypothetical protein